MRRIAGFIVRKRVLFYILAVLACLAALVGLPNVHGNRDMTRYLPATSQVRQGLDIMEAEFDPTASLRVMYQGLPAAEDGTLPCAAVTELLGGIDGVILVTHDHASASYVDGDRELWELTLDGSAYAAETVSVVDAVRAALDSSCAPGGCAEGATTCIDGGIIDLNATLDSIGITVATAVAALTVVLLVMCSSWVEPFIFLIGIGVGVLLNMGTNALLPSVSQLTTSIAAILQLALSMDYSIMLMDRYRQERSTAPDKATAMEVALVGALRPICSSSFTTIAGLLCLLAMTFTIGADLGIVLAKGVLLSLIAVLTLLPGLIITFDPLIQRTAKKAPLPAMARLAGVEFRGRYVIAGVFAILMVIALLARGSAGVNYYLTSSNPDHAAIESSFPQSSQIVVVYDSADRDGMTPVLDQVASLEGVRSVLAYGTTIGKPMDAQGLSDLTGVDPGLIKVLTWLYAADQPGVDLGSLPLGEVITFVADDMLSDPAIADLMGATAGRVRLAAGLMGGSTTQVTPADLADKYSIPEPLARMVFAGYRVDAGIDPEPLVSPVELVDHLGALIGDGSLDGVLPGSAADLLDAAEGKLADAEALLVGAGHERAIITADYSRESPEVFGLLDQMSSMLDATGLDHYIVGDAEVSLESSRSFPDEYNMITLLTMVVIFGIVVATFRNPFVALVLVLLIQTAINLTIGVQVLQGFSTYYVAMMIVQALLMGSTIDYAILFTSCYREHRATLGVAPALAAAYRASVGTILTSGSILVLVTLLLGILSSDVTTSEVCLSICKGSLVAVICILTLLPGTLAALDRWVVTTSRRA